jgi:hypothetical protein
MGSISTMAHDTYTVIKSLDSITVSDFGSDELARAQAVTAARRLLQRLLLPTERMVDVTFGQPLAYAALQVFHDLGISKAWAALNQSNNDKDLTVDEIAKLAAVEPKA